MQTHPHYEVPKHGFRPRPETVMVKELHSRIEEEAGKQADWRVIIPREGKPYAQRARGPLPPCRRAIVNLTASEAQEELNKETRS